MRAAGMATTGKHFPGHGWAEADSHVAIRLTDAASTSCAITTSVPFRALAPVLDAVMPAHVSFF